MKTGRLEVAALLVLLVAVSSALEMHTTCSLGDQSLPLNITFFDRPVKAFSFASSDQKQIYAVTKSSSVYSSFSSGSSWSPLNPLLPSIDVMFGDSHGVDSVIPTATDSQVWVMGKGQQIWTTRDGSTFQYSSFEDQPFASLVPNPKHSDWAFALRFQSLSCRSSSCPTDLFATQDFGITWTKIASQVYHSSWIDDFDLIFLSSTGPNQSFPPVSDFGVLQRSNSLNDPIEIASNCVAYQQIESSIFAVVENSPNLQSILLSSDNFNTFQELKFPPSMSRSDLSSFRVVENKDSSFFVHLAVDDESLIFSSGENDLEMTPILSDPLFSFDCVSFSSAASIDGVFLSSVSRSGAQNTLISFNQGSDWSPLSSQDGEIVINDLCNEKLLNIKGGEGIMVGSGFYTNDDSTMTSFMTTDGGSTWKPIAEGKTKVVQSNMGSIFLSSSLDFAQSSILFSTSMDFGDSWRKCVLDFSSSFPLDGMFEIVDILSVGDEFSTRFIISGFLSSSLSGFVASIDVFPLFPSQCQDDDFEEWEMEGEENGCILGMKTFYQRRISSNPCFISSPLLSPVSSPCPCSSSDYECDGSCFVKGEEEEEGECLNVCEGKENDPTKQPENCSTTWNKSQGFRLIPGTKCINNVDDSVNLLPQPTKCDVLSNSIDENRVEDYYYLPPSLYFVSNNDSIIIDPNSLPSSSSIDGDGGLGWMMDVLITIVVFVVFLLLIVGVLVMLWVFVPSFRDRVNGLSFIWTQKAKHGYEVVDPEDSLFPSDDPPSRSSSRTLAEDIFDFSDPADLPDPIKPTN